MKVNTDVMETTKKVTSTKELAKYVRDIVTGCEVMTDEEKAKMDARIISKLKSGRKLSQKELDYLRKTNPVLYMHAMRVQRKAEAVEEQLKHAKSKEEADRIVLTATSMVSDKDPAGEYILAAINRVSEEFHKSGAYDKLPDTTSEAAGGKKYNNGNIFSDGDDDNNRLKLLNWSPLDEVYEMMPTFFSEA